MSELRVQGIGDHYYLTTAALVFDFGNLREHSDGLSAELTVTVVADGRRHWTRLNLASVVSRAGAVKAILRYGPFPEVAQMLDEACYQVVQLERLGEPAAALEPEAPSLEHWLLRDWIPAGDTSILYGDGGSAKSMLALALALAGLTGEPLAKAERWRVAPVRSVLYLDWESRRQDHAARLWGLLRMHGAGEAPVGLLYRRMTRALTESLTAIRHDVAEHRAELVVVDSLGAACGAEPESADAAVRTLNALRTLDPATRLVLAHVSKAALEHERGRPKPYGSVYVSNLARSTILAQSGEQDEDDHLIVTYHHTKSNTGAIQGPRALQFSFDDGKIGVTVAEPDLARASIPRRILDALKAGAQTGTSLAEVIGVNAETVRRDLGRLANRDKVVRLTGTQGGRGKETLWGLLDTNRDNGHDKPGRL